MFFIPALFLLIATLYSMVGFGGGSSYTALLALSGNSPDTIRWTALSCNLAVVSLNLARHLKQKSLKIPQTLHFLTFSIPVVFITAQWRLTDELFFTILGTALTLAGSSLFLPKTLRPLCPPSTTSHPKSRQRYWMTVIILGSTLGALAGLTGIGGGIYLSPILLLIRFDTPKQIAALASAFIFVNSLIALFALSLTPQTSPLDLNPLHYLLPVIAGGFIGSKLLHQKISEHLIRKLTGALVLYVGVRILLL